MDCFACSKGILVIFSMAHRHLRAYLTRSMNGSHAGRYLAIPRYPVSLHDRVSKKLTNWKSVDNRRCRGARIVDSLSCIVC